MGFIVKEFPLTYPIQPLHLHSQHSSKSFRINSEVYLTDANLLTLTTSRNYIFMYKKRKRYMSIPKFINLLVLVVIVLGGTSNSHWDFRRKLVLLTTF